MLSGQYDFLVNNMTITNIIGIVLLVIPIFVLFFDIKWIFFYYTISIVANLPLIFFMVFNFSYEAIIALIIVIQIIRDIIRIRKFRYITTKENLVLGLLLILLLGINLITSLINLNPDEFLVRLIIYIVNVFVLVVYTYLFSDSYNLKFVKNGFIIGALILVFSMIVEMVYGHVYLNVRNMRPGGLLLDPNVCAFALNLALILSFMERDRGKFISDLYFVSSRVLIIFGVFLTVSRSAYIGTIFILVTLLVYYSKKSKLWISLSVILTFIIMYIIFSKGLDGFFEKIYRIIDLDRIVPYKDSVGEFPGTPVGGGSDNVDDIDYSNSRLSLIIAAASVFANNFITGVGIGNVTGEIALISGLEMNAHNLYLQLITESGILMLIALMLLFYYLIVFIVKLNKRYKFLVLLLFGLFFIESMFNHNLLNINITYLVLAIIFGLSTISSTDRKVFLIGKEKFIIRKKSLK